MTGDDDPFGLNDRDRTQITRPQPGGRGLARPLPQSTTSSPVSESAFNRSPAPGSGSPLPSGTQGSGPLVAAGFGLLALAPLLRSRTPPGDPAALRAQIERELTRFTDLLRQKGFEERAASLGHYCLCALLDDVILNTPWGADGAWRSSSLVGTLHHDVAAGERFFEFLNQAMRVPERDRPLLELMSACLALGFEGRYRLVPGGGTILQQLREELATVLSRFDSDGTRDLSGHWAGASAAHRPVAWRIPLWVLGSVILAGLLLVYAALAIRLGDKGDRLDALVAAMPPHAPVTIIRAEATKPVPLPVAQPVAPRLRACLAGSSSNAVDAVTEEAVVEDVDKVRVRLPNAGLFASGGADLDPNIGLVVRCLAEVLIDVPGKVLILGHTDNVPIHTARFPNNWVLSQARADAVAGVFRGVIADENRLVVEGRADTEPITTNPDEAERSRNRRVEIVLLK